MDRPVALVGIDPEQGIRPGLAHGHDACGVQGGLAGHFDLETRHGRPRLRRLGHLLRRVDRKREAQIHRIPQFAAEQAVQGHAGDLCSQVENGGHRRTLGKREALAHGGGKDGIELPRNGGMVERGAPGQDRREVLPHGAGNALGGFVAPARQRDRLAPAGMAGIGLEAHEAVLARAAALGNRAAADHEGVAVRHAHGERLYFDDDGRGRGCPRRGGQGGRRHGGKGGFQKLPARRNGHMVEASTSTLKPLSGGRGVISAPNAPAARWGRDRAP